MSETSDRTYDFIVVGSGAGGGPLAANLARAGFDVLLMEAGDDHRCPYYDVPIMQARASEDKDMRWDFFVHHYANDEQRKRDSKYVAEEDGVLYPRGSTLGGSTAISALVTVYPHNSDWDRIAEITGDSSWNADNMRSYFERIEHWRGPNAPFPADTADPSNPGRHGYNGWLQVSRAQPKLAGREPYFLDIINAIEETSREVLSIPNEIPLPRDPNDWRTVSEREEGMSIIPVAIANGVRNGARERVLSTQVEFPDKLTVQLHSLATRVLFDGKRAVGVEYIQSPHLFRADPLVQEKTSSTVQTVFAKREVILAGGAFNTPQLLKLSGIGPREELERLNIPVLLDAPGVGANLQDRYELGIVHELIQDFPLFDGAVLDVPEQDKAGDALFQEWELQRGGPYSTNGSLAAFIKRSSVADKEPDLFVFALPAYFRGYYPGYSAESAKYHNAATIVVLKGHTKNSAGQVVLRSTDPRDRPQIDFKYFEEGNDTSGDDLEGVVDGIELARKIAAGFKQIIKRELIPGELLQTRSQLKEFARNEAWGHHASCTCKIGESKDPMAVLDGDFRVRGIENLRVVDASVFPFIPGFFIASAVYMISEKASDVLIKQHS